MRFFGKNRRKTDLFATVLNGANQYWQKTSPTGLDLNGAETITNSDTRDFETNIGGWLLTGVGCSIVRSTADFHSGVASGLLTFTTNGNISTNFAYIPASGNSPAQIVGNKYTLEFWAKSVTTDFSITVYNGTTTKVFAIVAGSWTKCFWNYFNTDGNQNLRFYINGGTGAFYIDDVSFTQAYDAMILLEINNKTTLTTIQNVVGNKVIGSSGGAGIGIYARPNTNQIDLDINGANGERCDLTANAPLLKSGVFSLVVGVIDRSGNIELFWNKVSLGTKVLSTALGTIIPSGSNPLTVGSAVTGTASFFEGSIGQIAIIRFTTLPADGGASIIADAYNRFKAKKPFATSYPNGTVVANYDWKSQGRDISGNGNDLTNNNGALITRI